MRWDVFISHDAADERHGDRLRRLLEDELRLSVLIDVEGTVPHEDLTATVSDRLRGRGATFVVMTGHARASAWIARAIGLARARHHRVVPVVFDDAGALHVLEHPTLTHRFVDGRGSDDELVCALWRCLYASLLTAPDGDQTPLVRERSIGP